MPLDLVMGSEKVNALQSAIEKELARRNFSAGEDKVMAEYITIMLVNNKSAEQISSELEEFIGADIWDPSFTDWLFAEATKPLGTAPSPPPTAPVKTSEPSPPPVPEPLPIPTFVDERSRDELVHTGRRLQPGSARIYSQAVSGAQKRTASMRSPSPQGGPNKMPRRNDLPSGPRAMMREDGGNESGRGERRDRPRSLRDRMGGFANGTNNLGPMNGPPPPNMMMGPGGFIGPMGPMPVPMGMMGMDQSNMNQGALAEALMAQNQLLQNMMTMMQGGMMPNMQGMPGPIGPNGPNGPNGPPMPPNGHGQGPQRGRGRGRGGRGGPPADGGHQAVSNGSNAPIPAKLVTPTPAPPTIQAPQPKPAIPAPAHAPAELPDRPLSPTLCKFGVNCTNSLCRYSHPSAAATQESGIVLSTEACPEGRFCKDKDCKLSHPSSATGPPPAASAPAMQHHGSTVPCKFGANCTRPGCTFAHPPKPRSTIPCKFGVNCTRPDCMFTHPPKGWTPTSGGAASISVRFNPDAKPFVPKGAATAPVILETSSQTSSPVVLTKSLKTGDEPAEAPAAEEQKTAELVAAV